MNNSFIPPLSLEPDPDTTKLWNLSRRGYYDLTPPGEVSSDVEDPHAASDAPIDSTTEPLVAVIGVGYVGEHLITAFSSSYNVLGYDVSESRVQYLANKFSGCPQVTLSNNSNALSAATHYLISVPTLLLPNKTIDSSYLRSALTTVSKQARKGSTVVIESSVAVGMTRELLGPIAMDRGLFAGMSPERVDPGRSFPPAKAIPKIISGLDDIVPGSRDSIISLYSSVFDTIIPLSRPEVAEMMKLYENCQRMICIAYANEMADSCLAHGIDPFEVCRAAATKPFGYMPFAPGLGVGGHCIPVNPYYLLSNSEFPLLQQAAETMRARPSVIAQRTVHRLCNGTDKLHKPRILVVGIGFKPGQSHLANSPGLDLVKSLVLSEKVDVMWADPLVKQATFPQIPRFDERRWGRYNLDASFELIIVAYRQNGLDFTELEKLSYAAVDMWCP